LHKIIENYIFATQCQAPRQCGRDQNGIFFNQKK